MSGVKIAPGAVVCVESEIRGDVTIECMWLSSPLRRNTSSQLFCPRTVIHPKARIIAEAGPIIIGEGNLIEEQALIINAHPDNIIPDTEDTEPKPMIIGTNNVFEVGCHSQAMKMGDNNVIESKAYVGRNVILTSGCIIGACCSLNTFEAIPENTVIYGADCLRRVQTERPQPQTLQLDFLMKILPNYHHLKKTMKGSSTPVKN
ncbi:dynactin subunit 6 isoform X2 [Mus musculus]|uniref:dynactin subunit 6 isoform X2 n=1 Tax=Mus musculus TaxID=10090 RepID=UPI00167BDAE7|nr:dynactin subunit 6 isoform X2 [Mus musculus]